MKTGALLIIVCLLSSCYSNGQNKIYVNKYYNTYGIVFSKSYKEQFLIEEKKERINISRNDVIDCEKIIINGFSKEKYHNFSNHGRQYLGYRNVYNDKIVMVLINNNIKYPKMFNAFDKDFAIGLGDFFEDENNQILLIVNLTKKKIE